MMIQHQEAIIQSFTQSDGYRMHYRLWGQPKGQDVVVLLHGGISHSAWQAPLGEEIAGKSDISFIAVDRRGSGLNTEKRGHLLSKEREIEDVVSFIRSLQDSYERIHLAGWCFGSQVAASCPSSAGTSRSRRPDRRATASARDASRRPRCRSGP